MGMSTATASNRRLLSLGFFLLVCYAASVAGGTASTPDGSDWFNSLRKPAWTPASELLGPARTLLFGIMAVAAWLVWDRFHGAAVTPLKLFAYQLSLSVVWSFLFFALRNPDAAAAEIIVLWLMIAATTISFMRVHLVAGLLMVPYWTCVTAAAILNHAIARYN